MKCSLCNNTGSFTWDIIHGNSDICNVCKARLARRKQRSDWFDKQPKLYRLLHNRPVDPRLEEQILNRSRNPFKNK